MEEGSLRRSHGRGIMGESSLRRGDRSATSVVGIVIISRRCLVFWSFASVWKLCQYFWDLYSILGSV